MIIENIIEKIALREDLNSNESSTLINMIFEGKISDIQIAAILMGLKMKGETITEIASFAKVMRDKATYVKTDDLNLIDTCGTGGDCKNTFNISTIAAIIAASCGVKIAKHGNRGISSKCGSADVLLELGINISISPKQSEILLKELGISFLYAPDLHIAMKYVMPVRKNLGIRTIFNILGPLTNPARARKQIIGVFNEKLCSIYGEVLREMGHNEAFIVHGMDGLDEVSVTAPTKIVHLKDSILNESIFYPEQLSIKKASISDIQGGSIKENAKIILSILKGEEKGPKRDIAALNASFAILLSNKAKSIDEAYQMALNVLNNGESMDLLLKWKEKSNSFN